ncbi:proteasome subunit beta type-2-a [Quercus suber]|uniref:Proteasome subunit beta type-2-a n=1 Tax=Quercus suber TaxID=58331 RepID=A0AAW0IZB7_QUESU
MECVFGLVGNGFDIVVADSSAVHSILVHKSNEDKIMVLDSHKLIAASGEAKNVALYQFRTGIPLTTAAAANFTQEFGAYHLATLEKVLLFFLTKRRHSLIEDQSRLVFPQPGQECLLVLPLELVSRESNVSFLIVIKLKYIYPTEKNTNVDAQWSSLVNLH